MSSRSRNTGAALAAASLLCFYYLYSASSTPRTPSSHPPEAKAQRVLLAELDAEASRSTGDYWGLGKQQQQGQGERR
jgi:hypothetical protein